MEPKPNAKRGENIMAKAKKKDTTQIKSAPKKVTFISRNNNESHEMEGPEKGNLADQVLFKVLGMGNVPKGLRLQWASSYKGRFIARRGKNACGANNVKNLLIINGIADELESIGVKGIHKPEKTKNYKAIKLTKEHDLDDLASKIASILGFTGAKSSKATS